MLGQWVGQWVVMIHWAVLVQYIILSMLLSFMRHGCATPTGGRSGTKMVVVQKKNQPD